MNSSKFVKRALSAMLILSFFAASLAAHPAQAQAATTVTMYPGDEFTVWVDPWFDCRDKKIKSSNSKVADISDKDKKEAFMTSVVHLVAKKPGKATISGKVRGSSRTGKLNIVVKKLNFTAKILSVREGGALVLSVKNNMKVSFQDCTVNINFKDKDGKLIKKGTWHAYGPLAGKTQYSIINRNNKDIGLTEEELARVDASKCTAEVTQIKRSTGRKDEVKNGSGKIKRTDEDLEIEGDEQWGDYRFHCTLNNTSKEQMNVNVYVKIYDAQNHLIDVLTEHIFGFDGKSEQDVVLEVGQRFVPEYDHYEIVVQAYYTKKVKNDFTTTTKI